MPEAKRAPANEKMSAWLSLDGNPKSQATMPKMTMVTKQESAIMCDSRALEKLTNEKIALATLAPKNEVIKTPKKLNTPESNAPCQSFNALELTTEKIEFGASVQPLTKTTSNAKKKAKKPRGVSMLEKKIILKNNSLIYSLIHKMY